jgi:hypothetical protein
MRKRLPQLFSWFTAILLFFIPSNLFLVLSESVGFVNGLRIDYLLPKLFFTDFLVLIVIACGVMLAYKKLFYLAYRVILSGPVVVLSLLLLVAQAFSAIPLISFYTVLKIAEFLLLFLVLYLNKKYLDKNVLLVSITAAILIQLVFSYFQHTYGHSLTPYWLLGESSLNSSMMGLARASFGGAEKLLAYGTTPHPNVLAGISVLLTLLALRLKKYKRNIFWLLLIPTVIILFFTQSIGAYIALILGSIGAWNKRLLGKNILIIVIFSVLIIPFFITPLSRTFENTSIQRREVLNQAVFSMIEKNPLFGVGLGNFTAVLEKYMTNKEYVRFIQPAHNVAWLLFAETGLLGALICWQVIKRVMTRFYVRPIALALIPLLALDHYIVTTQSGILATVFFMAFCLKKIKVEEPLE